ncbi:MAG: hypothetical protein KIT60_16265 [Burkholderiaceae bacterium]|nr:hypothetical protein [Burkholderiaceae bacterium]
MSDHDITPDRAPRKPDPDEHPGEDGQYVDPARTRVKRRDPEGERLHEQHVPDQSDPDEHQGDV